MAKRSQPAVESAKPSEAAPPTASASEGAEAVMQDAMPAAESKPALVTESLMSDIEMPEVKSHIIEGAEEKMAQEEQQKQNEPNTQSNSGNSGSGEHAQKSASGGGIPVVGKTDKYGHSFDSALHKTNSDGSPKINATGPWRGYIACKSGKAGQGSKLNMEQARHSPVNAVDATPMEQPAKFRAMGVVCANLTFTLGQVIGGEDFRPWVDKNTGENEPEFMAQSWADYCQAKNWDDLPAGVVLSIAVGSYAMKRWNLPKVQERKKTFKEWVWGWFAKRAAKKAQSKEEKIKQLEEENARLRAGKQ